MASKAAPTGEIHPLPRTLTLRQAEDMAKGLEQHARTLERQALSLRSRASYLRREIAWTKEREGSRGV